jgi:hypothetical protein
MWKMYGDNGKGAFLRFDFKKLNKYCESSESPLKLKPCNYLTTPAKSSLIKELNSYISLQEFNKLLDISSFTKSIEWEYENEWRILAICPQNEACTKITGRGITEYVEVDLPILALKEICLGPQTNINDYNSICYMCENLNDKIKAQEIKVSKSKLKIIL